MDGFLSRLLEWFALPQTGLSTVFVVAFVSATLLPMVRRERVRVGVSAEAVRSWTFRLPGGLKQVTGWSGEGLLPSR